MIPEPDAVPPEAFILCFIYLATLPAQIMRWRRFRRAGLPYPPVT